MRNGWIIAGIAVDFQRGNVEIRVDIIGDESNPTKCSFFIFNEFSFWVVSYNWMLRLDNV